METSRREFFQETAPVWKRVLGLLGVALVLTKCGSESSPSPTAPTTSQPTPTPPAKPDAEIISAPSSYSFAVRANVSFRNVLEAFAAANVSIDRIGDKVTSIAGTTSPSWKIDVNGKPFCSTAGLATVPESVVIACYIEDGRKVAGSCLSDRSA